MKTELTKRLLGALGAGIAHYAVTQDWKASATVAISFVIYGAHSTLDKKE